MTGRAIANKFSAIVNSRLFIHVLYPVISFGFHFGTAIIVNKAYWQGLCWKAADRAFGIPIVTRLAASVGDWLATTTQFTIVGIFVSFMAEVVYSDTPSFSAEKRPKSDFRMKAMRYLKLYRDTAIMEVIALVFTNHSTKYTFNDMDVFTHFTNPFKDVTSVRTFLETYVWFALMVQTTLVLSDVLYTALHIHQHKWKQLYKLSGHSYHHTFHYPIANCGPWLSPIDLVISGQATFFTPIDFVMNWSYFFTRVSHLSPDYVGSFVFDSMLIGYINEMNDYDHCGKQCPSWSGFPLCPPLGFALGLHRSIPNHESHHNKSNCGFGLLGVADRCFGTYGVTEDGISGNIGETEKQKL